MKLAAIMVKLRKAWADWLLIFIFAGLLWLPTLDFFLKLDHTQPPGENRLPAPPPKLAQNSLAGYQQFLAATETYFNDHFGFRKRLIRWFQQWRMRLYHDQSVNKIIVGRDHWLFTGDQSMVDHYLGLAKFTPAQLKSWQKLLEKRRDWLAQRGIQYLFIIPPDKQTIYPEELPAWLASAAPTNRETKLDQFLGYMRTNSTVPILDLRPALMAAKSKEPVYLQNDTHWNLVGSFAACQAVIKSLTSRFPDLPPLPSEAFTWINAPTNGGDLARIAGSDNGEKNYFHFQPVHASPVLRLMVEPNFKSVWGVRKVVTVENPGALKHVVVIFHDSFGESWPPFLGQCFKRAIFEAESHAFNPSLISSNAPDLVINEMLERYFNTQDPEEMSRKDNLP